MKKSYGIIAALVLVLGVAAWHWQTPWRSAGEVLKLAEALEAMNQADPKAYCRKDYKNYSFFRCFVGGKTFIFQTVNATNYDNFADKQGDVVASVASNLPIPGGCPNKSQ